MPLVVVHGGPAAAGDLEPLARMLGERWHVLEPFQRGSSGVRLNVSRHVQDLHALVEDRCAGRRPIIVGHSWGAMLGLAFAAAHPQDAAALVLIGCGAFSAAARREFRVRLSRRLEGDGQARLADIERSERDPDRRLAAVGRLMTRVYAHDLDHDAADAVTTLPDARAHEETWADMQRLQRDGTYPAAFGSIRCPVLMLYGDADPHPGPITRDDLRVHLPQLEYIEIAGCGHSPWLERQARGAFRQTLEQWLVRHAGHEAPGHHLSEQP